MDSRLWKFSDAQLALMLGVLNTGEAGMKTRFLCEVSYRLIRAGGAALTEEEEDLIDSLMTCEFRLRENRRKRRRLERAHENGGGHAPTTGATQKKVAPVRLIR